VCLLFSFRDRNHEQAVADELRRRLPSARVVVSHEISPEFREYERASTTAVDAYLGPVIAGYLDALGERTAAAGLPEPLVMRSSGGVASLEEAAAHPAVALLSGPAAGPACYGLGGTRPTVTDANLLLGRLPAVLAGEIELDADAAARAFAGIDPSAALEVVNAEMLRALRVVSVERGHDPREFALVA